MKTLRAIQIASLAIASGVGVQAAALIPSSYSYMMPPEGTAQGGSYDYFDETGVQLIDGLYGVNDWQANLGNGPAYEWVGWAENPGILMVDFGTTVTVTGVSIGFNRAEWANIYLPADVLIDGYMFILTGSEIADNTRGTLSFPISWTGQFLPVALLDLSMSTWIFIDEMTFVPEPGAYAFVAGLGLLAFGAGRRFRRV